MVRTKSENPREVAQMERISISRIPWKYFFIHDGAKGLIEKTECEYL